MQLGSTEAYNQSRLFLISFVQTAWAILKQWIELYMVRIYNIHTYREGGGRERESKRELNVNNK